MTFAANTRSRAARIIAEPASQIQAMSSTAPPRTRIPTPCIAINMIWERMPSPHYIQGASNG